MRQRKLFELAVLYTLVFTIVLWAGCHKVKVTNTPTGVSAQAVANWYQAVGTLKTIQDADSQLAQTATNLRPQFPDEASYLATKEALGRLAQIDIEAAGFLKTVPQNWNQDIQTKMKSYFAAAFAALQDANNHGMTKIKDQKSLATINGFLGTLSQAVQFGINLTGGN